MATGQCVPSADHPCRVNLDLMPDGTATWMYLLTGVAAVVFAYGIWQMVQVWRAGKPWQRGDLWRGLRRLAASVLSHRKFRSDRRPGDLHFMMFIGFVVLFIGTTIVAIDADIFELILKQKLLEGTAYLWFELVLDVFGILFLVGVTFLFTRRYSQRPPQLHKTGFPERPPRWPRLGADMYALVFLWLIGVTGFLLEGLRLRHQIDAEGITYASWSFVGNALAATIAGWPASRVATVYAVLWWSHFALWTSILAILPWTKFKHIVTSTLNIALHDPTRQSRPALAAPFDLQQVMESGAADMPQVGVATIRDFTWKDRLSFDACTNCGRCEAQCPAWAAGRPLSPRKLIQDLKTEMWDDWRRSRGVAEHQSRRLTENADVAAAIDEVTLWSCTTCRACVTACPVDIEHVDMIVDMRRALVMESKLDENQQRLLVNLTNAGNPYGFAAADRADWRTGLPAGVRAPTVAEAQGSGASFEWLWWVGCSGSFDPRNQEVTRAIATILNAAEVDFAILGPQERCTGDPARRLGEEGRFQQSVMENLAVLGEHGVQKVITQCPHCFNTLANEYAQFGGRLEVVHHTQLIEQLMEQGRLPLKAGAPLKVTYHDSCYLGRHNGIFDAPRRVLQKAIGFPVLEMAQSREQGLCCGAGGANMWFEVKDEKQRINVIRAKQVAATGADTVATACPFCLTMVHDGLGLDQPDGAIVAQDLAEIVVRHLDWRPPETGAGRDAPAPAAAPPALEWAG